MHQTLLLYSVDLPHEILVYTPKNVSPDPYYCHSRALGVTSGVKRTSSPAVHGCTPTALPQRIHAFCHRFKPVA